MREFKISKHITLKLEDEKTNIYIDDKLFKHCKFLLMNIPLEEIHLFDDIEYIDEAIEKVDNSLDHRKIKIPPEVEFWGHCSNLQSWYENNYDTRFLTSKLAFPLLKKLMEVGDLRAEKVFKEEIAKKLETGNQKIITFLIEEGYTEYLEFDDFLISILNYKELDAIKVMERILKTKIDFIYKMKYKNQNGFMVKNRHVKYLSLSSRNIKTLPEEIGNFPYLEYLDLSDNEIHDIPYSIEKLKRLLLLKMNKNKIENIPKSLGKLNSLEILDLGDNILKAIPKSIGKLIRLKKLILYLNELCSLPESIGDLKSLEVMNLNSNKIEELPNSIGSLKSLNTLYLEYNKLKTLPYSIGNLHNLKGLYINYNNLSEIPITIGNLTSLEYFHLNKNNIKTIPKSLVELKNLKILSLKNNKIKRKENLPQELFRTGLSIDY